MHPGPTAPYACTYIHHRRRTYGRPIDGRLRSGRACSSHARTRMHSVHSILMCKQGQVSPEMKLNYCCCSTLVLAWLQFLLDHRNSQHTSYENNVTTSHDDDDVDGDLLDVLDTHIFFFYIQIVGFLSIISCHFVGLSLMMMMMIIWGTVVCHKITYINYT